MMKRSHGCLYDSQCNYHDHEGAGHRWTSDSDEFGGRWICHQRRNIPHLSHWRARVVSIAGAVNGQDCERGESRSVGDRDTITVVGRHAAPRAERLVINGGACTVQQPGALVVARWTALVDYAIAFSARPSPKPSTPPPPASRTTTMTAASERIRSDGRRPSPVIRGNE